MKDKFIWKTIGHQRQKFFLEKSIIKDAVSQAYLITGKEQLGKSALALDFIKLLQCGGTGDKSEKNLPCGRCRSCLTLEKKSHPDVLIIKPEQFESKGIKKERAIGIKEIRKLQHQLGLYPYCSPYKIGLILEAEKMTQEAANALLKTLEEPSGEAVIILTAQSENFILPTIVSRCQVLKLLSVSQKEIEEFLIIQGADQSEAQKLSKLSNGKPELAFEFYKNPEKVENFFQITKELQKLIQADYNERYKYIEKISKNAAESKEILKIWLVCFRDMALEKLNCHDLKINLLGNSGGNYSVRKIFEIIRSIKETEKLISTTNVNARLALENLVLQI
jgi:DNA polymerase-3 subunit delta'